MQRSQSSGDTERRMPHALQELEDEAIHVIRECAGTLERAAILFSGGKDSVVVAQLTIRAFHPAPCPFPLLHIDTGHNFFETLEFRDQFAARTGLQLIVKRVQDSIDRGTAKEEQGPQPSRNAIQSVTLLEAIKELKLDACLGGARRDEEKARAKERFFSHRSTFGNWSPKTQRPEVWEQYNTRKNHGENFRVFPISNWTEEDVYAYIKQHQLPLPSLYFAHRRDLVRRDGVLMAKTPWLADLPGDEPCQKLVRFRTVGDATCTGAIESSAETLDQVIAEVKTFKLSERSTRADDRRGDAAMERRKKEGYF